MNFPRKNKLAIFLLCLLNLIWQANAQYSSKPLIKFQESRLKNGLRVFLVEDHSAPVIALDVTYDVGARDERASVMDLENAKRALTGRFALSLEQPAQLLQYIVTQKLYGFPVDYWANYPQRVAEVTAEDVQRVAQKYVDLPHLQIVAVGDASKIRPALEKHGAVEVVGADGKSRN